MSINALRDDIFSFMEAYLSPRQGMNDNTAILANEQATAAANAAATVPGGTMPGTQTDASPSPVTPPTPVATRVIPADVSRETAAAPDPASFGIPGAPPPIQVAGPPPAAPGQPPAVAPPPAGPSGFAGGPAAPPAPALPPVDPSGGIDIFKIWQQQADNARRAQAIERIADGGTLMAAAMTRSPSMRAALAGAAKGGGGGGGGGGAGNLSFEQLLKLQEAGVSAQQRSNLLRQLPGMAKQLGVSQERLQLMADTDPKQIAQLVDALSRPELHVAQNDDGTFRVFSKNNPEATLRNIGDPDPAKVAAIDRAAAQEQRAVESHPLDQAKKAGDILKQEQETIKYRDENERSATLRQFYADPERRRRIAEELRIPEETVEVLAKSGKLNDVLETHAKGTSDWQEYLKTDRTMSPTEWFKYQTEKRSPQISPFNEAAVRDIKDTMTKIETAEKTHKDQMPISTQKSRMIREGRGLYGQAFGSDAFKAAAGWWVDLFGGDDQRVTDAQTLGSMIKLQMTSRAKELGTQPTNYDEKLLMDALGGNTQNTRKAALEMARAEVRFGLRQLFAANDAIDRSVKNYGKDDPKSAELFTSRKIGVEDVIDDAFPPSEINAFLAAVRENPDKREEIMREFDTTHGKGFAGYVLGHRMPEALGGK